MNKEVVLRVENLSKTYRLGQIGTGTISHDLNRWWAKIRGKEDPFSTIGVTNDRSQKVGNNEYVKVLDNVNFDVMKGDVLGVIGRNGAGKSTLLKVISQITSPTTGAVKAKGRIASLLEVGTGMHPEMTGKENVYLNGTILGMTRKEIDKRFDEIMEFAGCAKYANTPVKRYSSGMKVRLGFAVAAFLEPEILIVDEVLAVGDAEFQKKAIGKMQDISKGEGRTVLFVSHNMESVRNLCGKCILLNNGSILRSGSTEDVIPFYLEMNAAISAVRKFEKSNQKDVQFTGVKTIGNGHYNRKEEIAIQFEVTFTNVKDKRVDVTFSLFDAFGNTVFVASTAYLQKPVDWKVGVNHLQFHIPPNLLHRGIYSIGKMIIVENYSNVLQVIPKAVDFEVFIGKELINLGGRNEGVVLPKMSWTKH